MARTDFVKDPVDRYTAGNLLGVGPRQVLRYVDKGWLTKYRRGNRVRYSRSQVIALHRRLNDDAEGFIPVQRAS